MKSKCTIWDKIKYKFKMADVSTILYSTFAIILTLAVTAFIVAAVVDIIYSVNNPQQYKPKFEKGYIVGNINMQSDTMYSFYIKDNYGTIKKINIFYVYATISMISDSIAEYYIYCKKRYLNSPKDTLYLHLNTINKLIK